jgi:predicted dehydrogenase
MKRVHLVGAGGMGKAWAGVLTESEAVELVGWSDLRPGAAQDAAREMSVSPLTGTDFRADIVRTSPDFVLDVTPPEVHREVTEFALSQGLPVLGEKPMADSMEAARSMVRASEASGKLYMVSQSRRYHGWLVAYRELTRDLGSLGMLNADFYLGPHFGGFREEMDSVLLLDMAIHTFDAARFLTGKNAVAVYAEEFNPGFSWYRGAACANAIFEMEGGARFCYRGSWCAEGLNTSWESEWRAVGERGSATWDGNQNAISEQPASQEGFLRPMNRFEATEAQVKNGIHGSLAEFLHALETGETPQGECHDNLQSLAMVFGAVESAKTGKRVLILDIIGA